MRSAFPRVLRCCVLSSACGALLMLLGCGGGAPNDAPPRFKVDGKVTWNGQPVPYGEITFEPDSKKGNKGPAARGIIENGAYVIEAPHGAVAGPLRIRIYGYDGKAPPGGGTMPYGSPLFPEYSTQVDQPQSDSTHDFAVPDAKGKK